MRRPQPLGDQVVMRCISSLAKVALLIANLETVKPKGRGMAHIAPGIRPCRATSWRALCKLQHIESVLSVNCALIKWRVWRLHRIARKYGQLCGRAKQLAEL